MNCVESKMKFEYKRFLLITGNCDATPGCISQTVKVLAPEIGNMNSIALQENIDNFPNLKQDLPLCVFFFQK